jgi:hypothetical protein
MILTYFNGGHRGALDTIYIYHSTYVLNTFHSLTGCVLLGYTGYLNKKREVRIVSDSDYPKPRLEPRPSPSPVIGQGSEFGRAQARPGTSLLSEEAGSYRGCRMHSEVT